MAEPYRPNTLEYPPSPEQWRLLNETIEDIYRELRRLSTSSSSVTATVAAGSRLLSATHTDTTPGSPVDGDLIVAQSGAWARKAKGSDDQVLVMAAGAPGWASSIPAAAAQHSLLSAFHDDTTTATAQRGDVIVAQSLGTADLSQYWANGAPLPAVPTTLAPQGGAYWLAGAPYPVLYAALVTTFARKAIGVAGSVLRSNGIEAEWSSDTLGSTGAEVYRAAGQTISDRLATLITFDTEVVDDGGFWVSTAPTRLTVANGAAGVYALNGQVEIEATEGGLVTVALLVNGVERARSSSILVVGVANTITRPVSAVLKLNAGDYVELQVTLTMDVVGTSQALLGGQAATALHMGRLASESVVTSELPNAIAGSLIKGNSSGTAYDRVSIGAANTVLLSDGSAPGWSTRPTLRDVAEAISGLWDFENGLQERGRTAPLGEATAHPYSAGDFTGSGGMTVTVDAGDVSAFDYWEIGDQLFVDVTLDTISITAPLSNIINITIPAGLMATQTKYVPCIIFDNSGTVFGIGLVRSVASSTTLNVFLPGLANYQASVNNTYLRLAIYFKAA